MRGHMQNEIQMHLFDGTDSMRTVVGPDGDHWIFAPDVCKIVDVGNTTQAVSRLDADERSTLILNDGDRLSTINIVSEAGFYSLVLSSRKQTDRVKRFKRWVTHEVLPSIRKTGSYSVGQSAKPVSIPTASAIPFGQLRGAELDQFFAALIRAASELGLEFHDFRDDVKVRFTEVEEKIDEFKGEVANVRTDQYRTDTRVETIEGYVVANEKEKAGELSRRQKRATMTSVLIQHPNWTNAKVACFACCTAQVVGKRRRELEMAGSIPAIRTRQKINGYTINTINLGRKRLLQGIGGPV